MIRGNLSLIILNFLFSSCFVQYDLKTLIDSAKSSSAGDGVRSSVCVMAPALAALVNQKAIEGEELDVLSDDNTPSRSPHLFPQPCHPLDPQLLNQLPP